MESKTPDTLEKIQQAALDEFSEKGFLGASLRQIVKHAGVTTGAFYGYFSSKEALFASIVEPHAAILMSKYIDCRASCGGTTGAHGCGIRLLHTLDGRLYLPA